MHYKKICALLLCSLFLISPSANAMASPLSETFESIGIVNERVQTRLNIRARATQNSEVIGTLRRDDLVRIVATAQEEISQESSQAQWFHIRTDQYEGYVRSDYLDVANDAEFASTSLGYVQAKLLDGHETACYFDRDLTQAASVLLPDQEYTVCGYTLDDRCVILEINREKVYVPLEHVALYVNQADQNVKLDTEIIVNASSEAAMSGEGLLHDEPLMEQTEVSGESDVSVNTEGAEAHVEIMETVESEQSTEDTLDPGTLANQESEADGINDQEDDIRQDSMPAQSFILDHFFESRLYHRGTNAIAVTKNLDTNAEVAWEMQPFESVVVRSVFYQELPDGQTQEIYQAVTDEGDVGYIAACEDVMYGTEAAEYALANETVCVKTSSDLPVFETADIQSDIVKTTKADAEYLVVGEEGMYLKISNGYSDLGYIVYNDQETSLQTHEMAEVPIGQQIADYAQTFVGVPYVWGGADLNVAVDCSGFTKCVYEHFGIYLPHYSGDQGSGAYGTPVESLDVALPGDLIFWPDDHVGIYLGDGKAIQSSGGRSNDSLENAGKGVCIRNVDYRRIGSIWRLVSD